MILVTGATGEFGKHAIEHLLEKGTKASEIAALVRSEEKGAELKQKGIELRIGDYTDLASLEKAFAGIEKLLFVSSSETGNRDAQHKNVVDAAKTAGVKHILYTSFVRNTDASKSAISFLQSSHLNTENWIKESGMTYTILQNSLYMDMLPVFAGEAVIESGKLVQPAENGKSASVLRAELAEAATVVLTTEGHENKSYPLTNTEAYTYHDVANYLSEISGKDISYVSPSPEEFKKALEEQGVPEEYIGMFTAFAVAQAKGELNVIDSTLEKLLGRKPTSTKDFLQKVYG